MKPEDQKKKLIAKRRFKIDVDNFAKSQGKKVDWEKANDFNLVYQPLQNIIIPHTHIFDKASKSFLAKDSLQKMKKMDK